MKQIVPKTARKTVKESVVIVRILRGTPTPAAKEAWRRWWTTRITECLTELRADSEAKGER
ncbi:MAG TPA: hypothetical protein VMW50_01125 [Dehalococcoidia bacterium]|nr:hypothetical protein [Dehalococcoidia bacterium]